MKILWFTIASELLIIAVELIQCETIVRVESGRHLIHVKGREPFMGNYFQLTFAQLHCVNSLSVDSLTPLTGAEEIELIYKICANDSIWHLAHYSNSENNFALHSPIYATVFALVTHQPISIVDVDVRPCMPRNLHKTRMMNIHQQCMSIDERKSHKHRKHHTKRFLVAKKGERLKRSLDSIDMIIEFTAKNSPYHISKNIIVHVKAILKIHAGTTIIFSQNTGIIAFGALQIVGTKYRPVMLYAMNDTWNGLRIAFDNADVAEQSQLIHLNVSGSKFGIRIESSLLPKMANIISDSNDNGLTILAHNNGNNFSANIFNYTLKKVTAINNRENGIAIHVGTLELGYLVMEEIMLASNQIDGLLLEGTLQVIIKSSQFVSNNNNGITTYLTNGSTLEVQQSTFDTNGQYGLQIQNARQIHVKCFSTSFNDHSSGGAILAKFVNRSDFLFDGCQWRSNNDVVTFRDVIDSKLSLLNGNLIRNQGASIIIEKISGKTNISIENNKFQQNGFHNNNKRNSIIELAMNENDKDVQIRIYNNRFLQNAMEIILSISRIGLLNMPTNAKITILENSFVKNLAQNTVYLAANAINMIHNTFDNFETQCELHSGPKTSMISINAINNYWGTADQKKVMDRICDNRNDKSLIPVNVVPFLNVTPIKSSMAINEQPKSSSLKVFATSLIIEKDEVAAFHEGTELHFKPNHGIIVFGVLHLLGQRENPILLKSSNNEPWLGIILDHGGIIHANHCILENAAIGLNVSSSNITIENTQIIRSISTGVLITSIYNGTFDMGESVVVESRGSGIRILKRQIQDSLLLRNARIMNCAETGIDFENPAGKIMLQNIVLENSGSFGILIAQQEEDELDSIALSNLTIRQQARGYGGILLNLKSYHSLHLNTSNFISNILPSLIIFSKCPLNDNEQMMRKMLVEKNRFINNENLVMRVVLEGCENAMIRQNIFIRNNEIDRKGALAIYVASKVKMQSDQAIVIVENIFAENKGEWSLFATTTNMNNFNGIIHNNHFSGNQNYNNSLIVNSEHFHLNDNKFEEFDYADIRHINAYKEILNSDENYWRNHDIISDEENDFKLKDSAHVNSFSRKRAAKDCLAVSNCSHNGQCVGLNVCRCNVGYEGPDCAQISCSALRNCSRNGYCIAPNICKCFDGWERSDCSEPTCHLVNNCSGHGTCVSRNECDCEPMFEGADCSRQIGNCSETDCNNHGLCVNNACVCETGWTGSFCSTALCDQLNNCSASGTCVRPQLCECFHGFTGDDCSICEGSTCDSCDAKCVHGRCNSNTRACTCRSGWIGPNCDICTTEKCDIMSVVWYVLPTAAGIHQKDASILVYGNDLPFVSSRRYTCLYGSTAADGFYISSSLVRCTIPTVALPGRYLFNIIPYGSDKAVPFFDKRLIHFTLYNECNQVECKGYCLGAVCVCPIDRDGALCEQVKIVPKLDREILNDEKLTQAVEGEPYTVKMPIQHKNTIFNVETDANGMIIYPNGMVFWSQPIGRIQPYTVNVTAASLNSQCMTSWNLTVKPTYTPVITEVKSADNSNMKMINGIVSCNAKLIGKVPVEMLVYQNDKLVENATTLSTADGHFRFTHYPFDETISTSAVVIHPGADSVALSNNITWNTRNFDIEYTPKIKMKPDEQIDEEYRLRNKGREMLMNCQLELIMPRDKIQIIKYEKIVKGIAVDESKSMKVTFAAGSTLDNTTLILQFKCIDTPKRLIRQQIEVERERSTFISYPSELLISILSQISPKIITVNIMNKQGYQFITAPQISIRPDDSPLFLISTKPSLQNVTDFYNLESTLTLFLSYRPLLPGTVNWTTAGDLILSDGNKQLFTVKYRIYAASNLFDFQITVMDELSASDQTHVIDDAEIMLRNDALGYDDKRHTKPGESAVSFSVIEGTYQLTIKSPTHVSIIMIVQPSFINSSLVVFAPINSPYYPVVEDNKLSLEEIDKQRKVEFPKLRFTPSTITVPVNGTEEVNLLINSDLDGPNDNIAILPSVEIQEQHLPFTLATADLRNGLGLGDGYHMKCKLSRVANHANDAAACTVFALQIPYIYMVPTSLSNYIRNVMILADNRKKQDDKVHLCEIGLQTTPKEASIWTKTTIYCNCATIMKERCRKQYVSATPCGIAWKYIPDDTVSLQTTAMFIVMIAECHTAGVNFHKMKQFLECVSLLNNHCPMSQQRLFRKNRSSRSQQRAQFFDQLDMVSEQADDMLQKYFPILKMLTSQTVDVVALYKAFFERLNILLPFEHFEEINDSQWFNIFFESISESSEGGLAITETEFKKLKNEKGGAILAYRWNATVIEWSKISSLSTKANISGMKFIDARELIISSDRLKTLARQYGADNPFALLHDYMGRLLSWRSENISGSLQILKFGNEDICAHAYTLITPEKPYENSEFQIQLKVINKKMQPLESVKVTLEMIQNRADTESSTYTPMQFRISPVMLNGIGNIDHTSKLPPNASFVASWNLRPVKNMRLIRETEYQAIVILKFTQNGRKSVQRIATQAVIFRPRPSLKIYYFISNLTHSKNTNTSESAFNVMIAFMNTGYSNLKNVKVEEVRTSVLSKDLMKNFLPYQINGIISNSNSNDDVEYQILSDLHFTIASIESGKTVNAIYNITTDFGQKGVIRDFKVTTSVNGELIELEDTQTFIIQQFISSTKFLVSLQIHPTLLFYYDMQKAVMRTIAPLIFVNANEKTGTSDGKPFRQQIISFRLNTSQQQQLTSFYGRIPYPIDLENDFEVLRVNQINKNGALKLVDPRHVWSSNTDRKFVHFIDDNPSEVSESVEYGIIYGNAELFLRPRFEFPIYNVPLVTKNWPRVGDKIARIMATSASQSAIRYELYSNSSEMNDYFSINPETGVINLRKQMQPKQIENGYCATVRAIDEFGRSETTVVTIGIDAFVRECHKLDNFSDLQPLTYIPSQFYPSKSAIEIDAVDGDAKYTSEIPKLYRLPQIATSSLSSTLSSTSTKITEAETFETSGYPVIPFVTSKHGYTKLIATQSTSDSNDGKSKLILASNSTFQLSSTVASNPEADSEAHLYIVFHTGSATATANATESNLNGPSFLGEFGSIATTTKSVSSNTEDTLLSSEKIQGESDRTNGGQVTSSNSFGFSRSGNGRSSDDKLWYSTSQRSDDAFNRITTDPYRRFSTMSQFGFLPKSQTSSTASLTLTEGGSFKTTKDSDVSLITETNVPNEDSKETTQFHSSFPSEVSVKEELLPVTVPLHTTVSPNQTIAYTESIYNINTTNTVYFYSPNSNLKVDLSSLTNNGKSIITDDKTTRYDEVKNYQSQMTSYHKNTHYTVISPISQITEFSGEDNKERSRIPVTKIPISLPPGEFFMNLVDSEQISEMACRLEDTQPIWSLICDLSKTSAKDTKKSRV